jgi:hypothetical protein
MLLLCVLLRDTECRLSECSFSSHTEKGKACQKRERRRRSLFLQRNRRLVSFTSCSIQSHRIRKIASQTLFYQKCLSQNLDALANCFTSCCNLRNSQNCSTDHSSKSPDFSQFIQPFFPLHLIPSIPQPIHPHLSEYLFTPLAIPTATKSSLEKPPAHKFEGSFHLCFALSQTSNHTCTAATTLPHHTFSSRAIMARTLPEC